MENNEQKYFDEEQYRTILVSAEENEEKLSDAVTALIALITDPANKEFKEDALILLKQEKAGNLLIKAISHSKAEQFKNVLVAACWESEINFSSDLPFFIDLIINENYLTSIEAITVVENMEGPFEKEHVEASIQKLKEHKKDIVDEKQVLINDLIDKLKNI